MLVRWKNWLVFSVKIICLAALLGSLLGKKGSGFPAESMQGLASPYFFSIAEWEARHLVSDLWRSGTFGSGGAADIEDVSLVRRYENIKAEITELEAVLDRRAAGPHLHKKEDLENRLKLLKYEKDLLKHKVKFALQRQISLELHEEGLAYSLPLSRNIYLLFPAVAYSPSELPHLLIVSPRERIELLETILLNPQMDGDAVGSLERKVERRGVSALVETVGGIATYPSLLSGETRLPSLLEGIAHEWFHHYLFFKPLGRNYRKDYQMTIINETVADIGGKEIGRKVLERYYPEVAAEQKKEPLQRGASPGVNINRELRNIRLKVDGLLVRGRVEEAEKYMEESRLDLERKGFFIRKLNQAYFAFHGSYGEAPAATSPIGPLLRQIRESSGSLANFVRMVKDISRAEQLFEIGAK